MHLCVIKPDSAMLCQSWVIWPFPTHENKLFICLQVTQCLYLSMFRYAQGVLHLLHGDPTQDWMCQTSKETNKQINKKEKKNKTRLCYLYYFITSGQIRNYFTENKADLNCYQLRTPYDFELAAAFYTHCQELQITTQGSGENQAFRLWKSYSWFTLVQAKTESTKQNYELCTEPSPYLPL